MPKTTPDAVPKVQAPHDAARDWAALSGRWGQQHSAPIPEGLAGLGARGQEPLTPGPTLAEVQAVLVRVQRLADSRISEMRRRDEAIGRLQGLLRSAEEERDAAQHQLREALAEIAAMHGHSPEGGKKVNG